MNDVTIHLSKETQEILLKLIEAIGNSGYKKPYKQTGPATEGQIKFIEDLLREGKDELRAQVLAKLNVKSIAEIPKEKCSAVIEYLKEQNAQAKDS